MKKNKILETLKIIFALAFVFAAASCSNIGVNTESKQTPALSTDSKLARLSVSVKDEMFESESTEISARTIRPTANDFKYSLDAVDTKTNTSATGFPKEWDNYTAMGKGTLEIAPGTYNFVLTIKDSDDTSIYTSTIPNKEVGIGDNFLVFTIEESATGTGKLKLTVSIPKGWDISSVEVALYTDFSSTTPVEDTSQTFTVNNTDDVYKANYEKTSLPVGSYIVKCKFTNSDDDEVSSGYMDAVQIKKDFPSTGTITLESNERFSFKYSDCELVIKPGDTLNLFEMFSSNFGDISNDNVKLKTSHSYFTISDAGVLSSKSGYSVSSSSSPDLLEVTIISKKTGYPFTKKILVDNDTTLTQSEFRRICTLKSSSYSSISSFTVPYGYKEIADGSSSSSGVFYGTYLYKLYLPETLEKIGNYAFYGRTGLNYIYTIGVSSSQFPKSLKSIGNYAFQQSGVYYVTLFNNVETIGDYAFYKCTSLKDVTLSDSTDTENPPKLKSIGDSAFEDCTNTRLTSITIPKSVETIGKSAFKSTNLKYAYFDNETGWKVYDSEANRTSDSGGTAITIGSSSTNATNLKTTYVDKYWGRRD